MSKKAWTRLLGDLASGQGSLLRPAHPLKRIAVLSLATTRRQVQASRQTQWTAYGLSVVLEELNYHVETCTPETMNDYDIVLYSVTSPIDQLSMVEAMPPRNHRSCTVVVGGQGAYPIWAISDHVDRVMFGRAESVASNVCLTDELYPFVYDARSDPHIDGHYTVRRHTALSAQEGSVGCKLGCLFCQYTYTRAYEGNGRNHYQAGNQGHRVAEDTFVSLPLDTPGHKTTALDGWSESTRRRVRKGITDNYIAAKIERAVREITGTINLKVFQIVGYPWETAESVNRDIEHMRDVLAAADPPQKHDGRVLIMFLNTPFSPEPLTPMEDDPANVYTDWRATILGSSGRGRPVYKGRNVEAFILPQIHKPLSLLRRVAVNRGASADTLRLLNRAKTVEDGMEIVPGIWEAGAGLRVSDYLSVDFLPPAKAAQFRPNNRIKLTAAPEPIAAAEVCESQPQLMPDR